MPRPVTIEDTVSFKTVSSAAIHPDGKSIVFAVGEPFGGASGTAPRTQLWTVSTQGGVARPYTSGAGADGIPLWSPDGSRLAFLSARDRGLGRQVYLIHRDFGEAERLTRTEGAIAVSPAMQTFAWSPDGSRIAFLMTEPVTNEETRAKGRGPGRSPLREGAQGQPHLRCGRLDRRGRVRVTGRPPHLGVRMVAGRRELRGRGVGRAVQVRLVPGTPRTIRSKRRPCAHAAPDRTAASQARMVAGR